MSEHADNLDGNKAEAMARGRKLRRCLACNAPLLRDVRPVTWTFRGVPLTYDQPAWWCGADPAHEYVMTPDDMRATEPLLKAQDVHG